MSSFVPRLLALTVVWLFATAALTFAAAHKMGAAPAKAPVTKAAPAVPTESGPMNVTRPSGRTPRVAGLPMS